MTQPSGCACRSCLEAWLARTVDLEIRGGAEGTVTDHDGTVREAVVEEVLPGRRLALRWQADGRPATIVELTLEDAADGRTRLVVVEVPLAVVRAISTQLAASAAFRGPALVAAA
ncbi:MAG: hypothetical protein JWN65_3973 [Solirubrobacterales bacterium]|nr:hypothetical protein [Solirubrobacterales bacterium]